MRILLTGGASGGHFYPIIAVAQAITEIAKEEKLLSAELFYMGPTPYDEKALFENRITYIKVSAGKRRRYASILNFLDLFRTGIGVFTAGMKVFSLYPDVVFSKGSYASFPAVLAARFFRIPVVIHESDSEPGRANAWAAKFAKAIALSYGSAAEGFKKTKAEIVVTGNPVRKEILNPLSEGAREFLDLEPNTPVILILGGSLGAQRINETVLDALPELLKNYQVIHQVGKANYESHKQTAEVVLMKNEFAKRYKVYDYLNELALRMSAGAASLVISRAGSTIFEIAAWGLPSIIVPIPENISHDQRKNAFAYARSGAAEVIEEKNLSPHVLTAEINRLMSLPEDRKKMAAAAKAFYQPDAAKKIARKIIDIALSHES